MPIDADVDDLTLRPLDREKLFAIFKELEFRTLSERVAKRLDRENDSAAVTADVRKPSPGSTPLCLISMTKPHI